MSVTEGCNKDTPTYTISQSARSTIGATLYMRRKEVLRFIDDEERLAAAEPKTRQFLEKHREHLHLPQGKALYVKRGDPDFWKRELAGIDAALTELGLMVL